MKIHRMRLEGDQFEKMRAGEKTVELRLFDEKRRKLRRGDRIIFNALDKPEELEVQIVDLSLYRDFYELYRNFQGSSLGYEEEESPDAGDMYRIYSREMIDFHGVLAIKIELI